MAENDGFNQFLSKKVSK